MDNEFSPDPDLAGDRHMPAEHFHNPPNDAQAETSAPVFSVRKTRPGKTMISELNAKQINAER